MTITTSANISSLDFEVQLDIASPVPKAIVTDISTYIGAGSTNIIGIVVKIIDPSNLLITTTVYPPNVDIAVGLGSFTKNLPYFNGQVKYGVYKIGITLVDQDGTLYVWNDTDGSLYKSINLCKPNSLSNAVLNYGGLNLSVDPNCDLGMLIVTDGGTGFSYNGVSPSETEAALTVTYPIDTTGTVAQQVATFIPFTFPLTVAGIYTIQGTVTQTYQLTETTSVKAAYYYQNTFDVQCGYTLCKALCDYEKLETAVKSCSIKNPNEAMQQLKTYILVIGFLGKIAWFKQCGKKFGNVLEQLRILGGFECNCECAPAGVSIAPLYVSGGTIVKGNLCGDIDLELTYFQGNVKIDLSDVTYDVFAAAANSPFLTVTPLEGNCSKQFTIAIDVCAMLDTVSIGCLSDVNIGSPAPADGDVLVFDSVTGEWHAETIEGGILFNDFADNTRTTVGVHKTYTLPANTLKTNGDQLIIKAHITANQTSAALIGVTDITFGATTLESMAIGNSLRQVDVMIQLIRVSDTTIRYMVQERRGIFNQIDSNYIYQIPAAVTVVPALSTNIIVITTTSSYFDGGVQINNELLSIELVKI